MVNYTRFLILIISVFFSSSAVFSQEEIAQKGNDQMPKDGYIKMQLDEMIQNHGIKQVLQPFERVDDLSSLSGFRNTVAEASYVRLKQDEVRQLIQNKPKTLSLPITLGDGSTITLELYEKSVFSPDAVVRTSDGDLFPPRANVHYRGIVKGYPGSLAGLSFFEDEVIGVVSTSTHGSIVIGLLDGQRDIHVIYKTDHLDAPQDFTCGVDSDSNEPHELPDQKMGAVRALDECIRVYIEADFALFQNKGGTQQVINYVTGIFNNVLIIYNNEQINAEISEIFVWTTMDNYSRSSSNTALTQFRSARQNFNGNLAHLFALGGNGLGGIAYVNVLCSKPNAFAYSNISSSYQNYPTYSWTIMVVTHEMGHNVGSNHTHWCGWAGGAIDNCYQTEGGCQPGPPPSGGGTVMSYCHLTNFGINLTKGFGPLPGDLIRSRVQNAPCLYECAGLCDNLTADFTITHTSCRENNGILEIDPSGGQAPYSVNIGNGFVQQMIFVNLAPGIYTVIVRDNNECEVEYEIEIEPSVRPEFTITAINTSCGEENGIIDIQVYEGNPPYEYNIGFGPSSQSIFFDLAGGTYNILVTDGEGCTNTAIVVIDPSEPLLADAEIRHTTCGNRNGRVTITATGGTPPYQYTYNGIYRQSPIFDSLPAGNYSFEVLDFYGCLFSVPVTVNGSAGVIATASTVPASCGGQNGSLTVSVSQGFSPFTYTLNGQSQSGNTFYNLSPGAYTVLVTDSTGCTRSVQATVGTSGNLALSAIIDHAWCAINQGAVTINPLNGNPPFSYDFGAGFQSENRIENLAPGMYSASVVDSSGCEGLIEVEVLTSPEVNISAQSTPSSCGVNDGTILISAAGGTPPFIYRVGSSESDDPLFEQLGAGNYWVQVEDSLGCTANMWVTVASESGLNVEVETTAANCGESDGTAIAIATEGTVPYTFDIGNGPQSSGVFSGLSAGAYTLTVTDAAGCSFVSSFTIQGFGPIQLTIETEDTQCGLDNGAAIVTVSGGNGQYQYLLNGVQAQGPNFENLPSGQYELLVTDDAGCASTIVFSIGASSGMTVNIVVTFSSCQNPNGAIEANVSGGYPPYSFDLGSGPQVENRFVGLEAGSYRLTIIDSLGCIQDRNLVVGNEGLKPVASFRAVLNGNEVIFLNTSQGNPESSMWSFGDGNTSEEFSPRHTYEELKPYQVCLGVFNSCGESTLCIDIDVNGTRDCATNDSLALVALYENTGGSNWIRTWDLLTPYKTWYGLSFNTDGCLTRIELEDNNIEGTLPEEIGDFLTLQHLNLGKNKLSGSIPYTIGSLGALEECILYFNNFEGFIPATLGNLVSLQHIDLSFNFLGGEIDSRFMDARNLRFVHLGSNVFNGEIRSDWGKLDKLYYLNLSDNAFYGELPNMWESLKQIQYLYINGNELTGTVPPSLAEVDSLKALWISDNAFTTIPDFTLQNKWSDLPNAGIRWENNRLTFRHLLPNKPVLESIVSRVYAPQAKVYQDTSIRLMPGENLTLDIEVDRDVMGVIYQWYRNGQIIGSTTEPVLTINQATWNDAGVYHCELQHPELPELVLVSHDIIIDVATAIEEETVSIGVKIMPNPVKGGSELWLNWIGDTLTATDFNLQISDMRGSLVSDTKVKYGITKSVVAPSHPGVYIVRLQSDKPGKNLYQKIIVY